MARVLLLIWGCGPCDSLIGWYDGSISGDAEGWTELDVEVLDETRVDIVGVWSPAGLPRDGEPNFSATRTCADTETVTEVSIDETWHQLPDSWNRWVGAVSFKLDGQGITGGWFFDTESGAAEDQMSAGEQLAGTWEASP